MVGSRGADDWAVAHETYAPGTPGFEAVVEAFGPGVVASDGAIDRRELGRLVFSDPAALKRLTDVVWPLTAQLLRRRRDEALAAGVETLVIDAAVLREAGWDALCDEVWLLRSPRQVARARLMARSGLDEAAAEARLRSQSAVLLGEEGVDRVIENAGSINDLEAAVDAAWRAAHKRATG
jgi:dephospho-CoA kinase